MQRTPNEDSPERQGRGLEHALERLAESLSDQLRIILPGLNAYVHDEPLTADRDLGSVREWTKEDMREYVGKYIAFPNIVFQRQNTFLLDLAQGSHPGELPLVEASALVELNARIERWLAEGHPEEYKLEQSNVDSIATGDVIEWEMRDGKQIFVVRRDLWQEDRNIPVDALRIERRGFLIIAKLLGRQLAGRKRALALEEAAFEAGTGPEPASTENDLVVEMVTDLTDLLRQYEEFSQLDERQLPELSILFQLMLQEAGIVSRLTEGVQNGWPHLWIEVYAGRRKGSDADDAFERLQSVEIRMPTSAFDDPGSRLYLLDACVVESGGGKVRLRPLLAELDYRKNEATGKSVFDEVFVAEENLLQNGGDAPHIVYEKRSDVANRLYRRRLPDLIGFSKDEREKGIRTGFDLDASASGANRQMQEEVRRMRAGLEEMHILRAAAVPPPELGEETMVASEANVHELRRSLELGERQDADLVDPKEFLDDEDRR